MKPASIQSALTRSWWVLFPAFAVLVARLAVERTCGDPYDLLAALMPSPAIAWVLAGIYVIAHVWTISAYLVSLDRGELLPGPATMQWGKWKIYAMVGVLAIEYCPATLWRFVGTVTGCAG
jgi:hypothetical protein